MLGDGSIDTSDHVGVDPGEFESEKEARGRRGVVADGEAGLGGA